MDMSKVTCHVSKKTYYLSKETYYESKETYYVYVKRELLLTSRFMP